MNRPLDLAMPLMAGAILAGAMLSPGLAAPAPQASASPLSRQEALLGVWMGISPTDTGARWRNTPWAPTPVFTEAGAAESAKWNTPLTPGECDPFNPAWYMSAGPLFPLQITTAGNQLVLFYEATTVPRRIHMDGRPHPDDLDPTWLGHAVGHWEGDTLVVDTVGTNGRAKPINGFIAGAVNSPASDVTVARLPASDQLHMVERIRVIGGGAYLEDEITVDDPKTYQKPFSAKHYWRRRADLDIQEYYCADNRRDSDSVAGVPAGQAGGR